MFQTLNFSPLLPSLRPRHRAPSPPPCTPFDEHLITALKSLPPIRSTLTLSWLAAAAAILSSILSAAPVISQSDDLTAHLDASDALLDACNEITAATNRLIRRRLLLLRLALHLLPTDHRRARATLAEWEAEVELPIRRSDLTRNLRTPTHPRKISGARGEIFAIEAVAALVSGAALVVLGGAKMSDVNLIYVSEDVFPWAAAFNKVAASVYSKLPEGSGGAGEVVAVEKTVKELAAALDGGQEGEEMRIAAEEAVEVLTETVERLAKAVSCVFRAAVSVRRMWLQSFLVTCYK